jgi:biopolymer transport protein ExbD
MPNYRSRFMYINFRPNGDVYLNHKHVAGIDVIEHLMNAAKSYPQPEIYVIPSADIGQYEFIGKVIYGAQRAGFEVGKVHIFMQAANDPV